jgi:hypothetical protein
MVSAIHARKSTEQTGTAEEAKSVTRQIDHARALRPRRGGRFSRPMSMSTTGSAGRNSRSGRVSSG